MKLMIHKLLGKASEGYRSVIRDIRSTFFKFRSNYGLPPFVRKIANVKEETE